MYSIETEIKKDCLKTELIAFLRGFEGIRRDREMEKERWQKGERERAKKMQLKFLGVSKEENGTSCDRKSRAWNKSYLCR